MASYHLNEGNVNLLSTAWGIEKGQVQKRKEKHVKVNQHLEILYVSPRKRSVIYLFLMICLHLITADFALFPNIPHPSKKSEKV